MLLDGACTYLVEAKIGIELKSCLLVITGTLSTFKISEKLLEIGPRLLIKIN